MRLEPIEGPTVLPGVTVDRGVLVVDEARLTHVGDLLHEAGHVGLAAEIVFHDDGYRGGSRALVENFRANHYVGVPILTWRGLTTAETCPAMARWLAT